MPLNRRFSPYFYNIVSYIGVWLAFLVLLVEIFLFILDYFNHGGNLYLGLLTYIVLPPFLLLGLLLIPFGALWKRRRVSQGKMALHPEPIRIDPSLPTHRNAIFVFMTVTFVVVVMTLVGSYHAFHYTESTEFCGLLCHKIMSPEYTTYKHSPHARVKCVECHIGAGADWYVRSKVSGARQVLKAMTDTHEKPIRTPVHDLRPAEDTCAQCHFPGKYFTTVDLNRSYHLSDGSDWRIRMLMQVGAGEHGAKGVHAHMNVDKDVYYAADDERRQKISWVKVVDKDGRQTVYTSPDSPYKGSVPPPEKVRKMDCIDCHNRPTHQFRPPYQLLNDALDRGAIDATLPGIKEKASALLSKEYKDTDEAVFEIRKLPERFREKHPEEFAAKEAQVRAAAAEIERLYRDNFFPEMKVRWDTHPDNIGHLYAPGCFRCHDGEHRSPEGKTVTQDCKACHVIVEQGPKSAPEKDLNGLEFKHPGDEEWQGFNCTDCHNGA